MLPTVTIDIRRVACVECGSYDILGCTGAIDDRVVLGAARPVAAVVMNTALFPVPLTTTITLSVGTSAR